MKKNPHLRDTNHPARPGILLATLKRTLLWTSAVCLSLAMPAILSAATQTPKNLGNSLDKVVARELAAKAGKKVDTPGQGSAIDLGDRAIRDAQGRLLVTVYLKNPEARGAVAAVRGLQIKAEDMTYQGGAMDVFVPAERVTDLANAKGVSSVFLVIAPVFDVGATTSQGVHQHRGGPDYRSGCESSDGHYWCGDHGLRAFEFL